MHLHCLPIPSLHLGCKASAEPGLQGLLHLSSAEGNMPLHLTGVFHSSTEAHCRKVNRTCRFPIRLVKGLCGLLSPAPLQLCKALCSIWDSFVPTHVGRGRVIRSFLRHDLSQYSHLVTTSSTSASSFCLFE